MDDNAEIKTKPSILIFLCLLLRFRPQAVCFMGTCQIVIYTHCPDKIPLSFKCKIHFSMPVFLFLYQAFCNFFEQVLCQFRLAFLFIASHR